MSRRAKLRKDAVELAPGELVSIRRLLSSVERIPEHVPVSVAAQRLGLAPRVVRDLLRRGALEGRGGKPALVSVESVRAWLGVPHE